MTGQLGIIYMLHFDQALPARQTLRRLDRRPVRPARPARPRARRAAGRGHLARRYRLHPDPHLRGHPPPRARHQERGRRGPVLPGLHPPALDRPLVSDARRLHPPQLPQPRRKAVTPHAQEPTALAATSATTPTSSTSCSSNFHRTPAGIAWRWRTELLTLTALAAALLAAGHLGHPHLGRHHPGRAPGRGPGRAALPPVHHPARLVRAGPAPPPAAVLRGAAAHPLRAAPAHLVDPADQGRRTHLGAVPRGHLRRGLRSPHRGAARRLLRPRRAGHPQPPVVAPADHRHHPPRHARGPRDHRLPARAAHRRYHIGQLELVPPLDSPPDQGEPAA